MSETPVKKKNLDFWCPFSKCVVLMRLLIIHQWHSRHPRIKAAPTTRLKWARIGLLAGPGEPQPHTQEQNAISRLLLFPSEPFINPSALLSPSFFFFFSFFTDVTGHSFFSFLFFLSLFLRRWHRCQVTAGTHAHGRTWVAQVHPSSSTSTCV